jgi:alkylation response protein AidB-like acyl-CoA dehydrogenase
VNFELSDDQQAIKRTARDFLAARYKLEEVRRLAEDERGFTDEQWTEIAGLGWPGVMISEDRGGLGLGALELVVICEELGYALAPTPFLSTVAAGLLLAAGGAEDELEGLASGERRGAVALSDEDGPPQAVDGRLVATKIAVPDAGSADVLVVGGPDGEHWAVDPHGVGVHIEPAPGIDATRKLFTVRLTGAPARDLAAGEAMDLAHTTIAAAIAAESVGVAQRAMEMAVEYAKDRQQFGRPIGAYQAVSHRCAQMLLEVEGARGLSYFAGWALDNEPESATLAGSMAKAYASDAGWRVAASSLQVHGGIGFTWEHDIHLFLKRAKANAHAYGDARWHRERVAQLAGV